MFFISFFISISISIYFYIYIYIYILEIGGCELVKVPPNREMLCKRCEHVSECECNVIREGVALVVRSFQNSFFFVCFSPRLGLLR